MRLCSSSAVALGVGQNWLKVLARGDTDEIANVPSREPLADEFDRSPAAVLEAAVRGGVSLPWTLCLAALIGLSLLFTRLLGVDGHLANAYHVIGSLVLTVVSLSAAEVARPVRFLNVLLGAALAAVPFFFDADVMTATVSVVTGIALAAGSASVGGRSGTITENGIGSSV